MKSDGRRNRNSVQKIRLVCFARGLMTLHFE